MASNEQSDAIRPRLGDELPRIVAASRASLDKIGEGDWTPQDSAHLRLVIEVERALARGLHFGRIVHGDDDGSA